MTNPGTHVVLEHMFFQGGTTVCRHVLYELRNHFVCIAVNKKMSAKELDLFVKRIRILQERTGLPAVTLVDIDNVPQDYTAADVHHLLQVLCQVILCRHPGKIPSVVDKKMKVIQLLRLLQAEQQANQQFLLGSRKSIVFRHEHNDVYLDAYIDGTDCLLDTTRIVDEVNNSHPGSWQALLLAEAHCNPN